MSLRRESQGEAGRRAGRCGSATLVKVVRECGSGLRSGVCLLAAAVCGCGPSSSESCLETEWVQTVAEQTVFCGLAVLPGGEFGLYVDTPGGPRLRVFDEHGVQLADRELPTFEERASCGSIATDPSGGWWLTAIEKPTDELDRYSSLHRLVDRDAAFASRSTAFEDGDMFPSVVALPGGVLLGGGRSTPADPTFTAISAIVESDLDEQTRWVFEDLGGLVRLESAGGVPLALATTPAIDYGGAFLLRLEENTGAPVWAREVGLFGGDHDLVLSMATSRDAVLLFRISRELTPGTAPLEPGDARLQSRSVVEARDMVGDLLWEHTVIDRDVESAHLAANEDLVLAWRGDVSDPRGANTLELSAFEVLDAQGGCVCSVENTVEGRVLDIAALRGQPGSFLVASEVDQALVLTWVQVRGR